MTITTSAAIVLSLLSAATWGSWGQAVKFRKNYPVAGIAFWNYTVGLVLVWVLALVLAPFLIPQGIVQTTLDNLKSVWILTLSGAALSVGMSLNLYIIDKVGLMLSTTIVSVCGGVLGTIISVWQEGVPDKPHALALIVIITVIFIVAGYICSLASNMVERDRLEKKGIDIKTKKPKNVVTVPILLLTVFVAICINGWTVGTVEGTTAGLHPLMTGLYIGTGSFISIFIACAIIFTKNKQWKTVLGIGQSKKGPFIGGIAGLVHHTGDLFALFSMPVISATITLLFARTVNLWAYFWAFYYKEFAGAKKKTIIVLVVGIITYFAGIALLFYYNYS